MHSLKRHHHLLRALIGLGIMIVFMTSTSPGNISLGFLAVPIILLVFVIYELMRYVFSIFWIKGSKKRQQAISLIVAGSTGLIFVLQSIGQLSVNDFAIIMFFVIVAMFYAARFR